MKKSILAGIFLALSTFLYAEVPSEIANDFTDKSAIMFDANDYAKYYSEIKALNKTAEKIELNVYAYDSRISKKTGNAEGWIKFGSIKVSDYNDEKTLSKAMKYLATNIKEFRYFAYTLSTTQREVKQELSYNNEIFEIRLNYVKAIQPLASLEVKNLVEKNPLNKKEILGIMAEISFRNVSDKLIKKIELTLSAYDKGMISKTIDGNDSAAVLIDELIEDGDKFKRQTKSYWKSISIDSIKVTKVKVIYNDNTELEYKL